MGVPQLVPAGYVVRDWRVGASRDYYPHTGRRFVRQQRGDAVRILTDGDATVFIQAIHDQDQPLTARGAGFGGLVQHPQEVGVAGGGRQGGQVLSQQLGQLIQHDLGECLPTILCA